MISQKLANSYELEGYENREVSPAEIHKMLASHGCDSVTCQDKYLVALGCDGETEDTTNWKLFDLLAFLNY